MHEARLCNLRGVGAWRDIYAQVMNYLKGFFDGLGESLLNVPGVQQLYIQIYIQTTTHYNHVYGNKLKWDRIGRKGSFELNTKTQKGSLSAQSPGEKNTKGSLEA